MKTHELTGLAEAWLIGAYPNSIIVRELSVARWGGAMIDIAAITEKEIVGVEVKGESDSARRLPLQGLAYGMVARKMWLLPDKKNSKQCRKAKPPGWGELCIYDGVCKRRIIGRYKATGAPLMSVAHDTRLLSPYRLCGALWKSELVSLAGHFHLSLKNARKVRQITDLIIKHVPVIEIHDKTIALLRSRVWKKDVLDLRKSRNILTLDTQ